MNTPNTVTMAVTEGLARIESLDEYVTCAMNKLRAALKQLELAHGMLVNEKASLTNWAHDLVDWPELKKLMVEKPF